MLFFDIFIDDLPYKKLFHHFQAFFHKKINHANVKCIPCVAYNVFKVFFKEEALKIKSFSETEGKEHLS